MKTREQYEDIFQEATTKMLPKFPLENIRPAFQKKGGKNGRVIKEDGSAVALVPFENGSDYIYFNIKFDTENSESFVYENGDVDITRTFQVIYTCYGNNSAGVALLIKSLIRTQFMQTFFTQNGFYLLDDEGISQLNEVINAEYWERRDLTLTFNERVEIKVPEFDNVAVLDNKVLVNGVGK